jgi:IS30 family transposase
MKGALAMPNNKHLTYDDRGRIHTGLNSGESFRQIASKLDKDPSTISKEVRKHRIAISKGAFGHITNRCVHRSVCKVTNLCDRPSCNRDFCHYCKRCNKVCPDFDEEHCSLLSMPPYVCNSCGQQHQCVLNKYYYRAIPADKDYHARLSDSRSGLSYTEDELWYMDEVITPLVRKKQSIHHICATQADKILCSERTVYKLVNEGVLSVRNIDLPRKVRYRPRQKDKPFKVDRNCRTGRTWEDFQQFMVENPDTPIVEMDTVMGRKGGKVLLTIFFTQSCLMLAYIRDHNTSQSVIDIFNNLDRLLGREVFSKLCPVLLTDNGSEFSNPSAIEFDSQGNRRTQIFYCDPSAPYQKGGIERGHEFIRMVLPKGRSFDHLTQSDVDKMLCHINSLVRKKLNDMAPTTTFSFFHGDLTLHKLGLREIPPDEVTLTPALLSPTKEVSKLDENL